MELLLVKDDSWDLYLVDGHIRSIAKAEGAADSFFGSIKYFKRYVDYNISKDKNFINRLTKKGLDVYAMALQGLD